MSVAASNSNDASAMVSGIIESDSVSMVELEFDLGGDGSVEATAFFETNTPFSQELSLIGYPRDSDLSIAVTALGTDSQSEAEMEVTLPNPDPGPELPETETPPNDGTIPTITEFEMIILAEAGLVVVSGTVDDDVLFGGFAIIEFGSGPVEVDLAEDGTFSLSFGQSQLSESGTVTAIAVDADGNESESAIATE